MLDNLIYRIVSSMIIIYIGLSYPIVINIVITIIIIIIIIVSYNYP